MAEVTCKALRPRVPVFNSDERGLITQCMPCIMHVLDSLRDFV